MDRLSRRELLWVSLAVAAYPLLGIASLVTVAYASSVTGVAAVEREFVLAAQAALWGALSAAAVAIGGRLLAVPRRRPTAWETANVAIGMVAGVALAYTGTAAARQGNVLDADTLGILPILPAVVLALASARLGVALTSASARAVWAYLALFLGVATIVVTVLTFATPRAQDATLAVSLVVAGLYSLIQIGNLARDLMDSRRVATTSSGGPFRHLG